uniref:G-protein coupled receptors family 1 profile domain-containing protein n=1 Tax=Parascaris univalens TaxID=6257 RepID=A0A914ZHX3_PARUN
INLPYRQAHPPILSTCSELSSKFFQVTSLIGLIILCGTVMTSSVLYLSTFIKLKMQANIKQNTVQLKRKSFEKRVLASCLLPFTALILASVLDGTTSIIKDSTDSNFLAIYNELWSFFTDLLCLSHPFSLVLTCRSIREDLLNKILHKQQRGLAAKTHTMTAWNTVVKPRTAQS